MWDNKRNAGATGSLEVQEKVSYDPSGLEALTFTADGDMRQAINNLQATAAGFGFVNQVCLSTRLGIHLLNKMLLFVEHNALLLYLHSHVYPSVICNVLLCITVYSTPLQVSATMFGVTDDSLCSTRGNRTLHNSTIRTLASHVIVTRMRVLCQ